MDNPTKIPSVEDILKAYATAGERSWTGYRGSLEQADKAYQARVWELDAALSDELKLAADSLASAEQAANESYRSLVEPAGNRFRSVMSQARSDRGAAQAKAESEYRAMEKEITAGCGTPVSLVEKPLQDPTACPAVLWPAKDLYEAAVQEAENTLTAREKRASLARNQVVKQAQELREAMIKEARSIHTAACQQAHDRYTADKKAAHEALMLATHAAEVGHSASREKRINLMRQYSKVAGTTFSELEALAKN